MSEDLNDQVQQIRRQLMRWQIVSGVMALGLLTFAVLFPWKQGSGGPALTRAEREEMTAPGRQVPDVETIPGKPGPTGPAGDKPGMTYLERIEELRAWGMLTPENEANLRKWDAQTKAYHAAEREAKEKEAKEKKEANTPPK